LKRWKRSYNAKIQPKQGYKRDGLEKTVAWTPRTLKQIKDGKDMSRTRFKGFSMKKQGFQGLNYKKTRG
jgi:hypothetical protein